MGLDMYLTGEKYFSLYGEGLKKMNRETDEGFTVEAHRLSLGYWRKHPDLHGYIVEYFAGGDDDCKPIDLSAEHIEQIIDAVKSNNLVPTTGCFFGSSYYTEDEVGRELNEEELEHNESVDLDTINQLQAALDWLNTPIEGVWKSVEYRASW